MIVSIVSMILTVLVQEKKFDRQGKEEVLLNVIDAIKNLTAQEAFGVLCTLDQQQPFGYMVALAFSADLKFAVFASKANSRKHRLLCGHPQVALVLDSRSQHRSELMRIESFTAEGKAFQVNPGDDSRPYMDLLNAHHPELKEFIQSSETVLFRIDIHRYVHVSKFQDVQEWVPVN